jgi:hypothetical protein
MTAEAYQKKTWEHSLVQQDDIVFPRTTQITLNFTESSCCTIVLLNMKYTYTKYTKSSLPIDNSYIVVINIHFFLLNIPQVTDSNIMNSVTVTQTYHFNNISYLKGHFLPKS